MGGRGPKHLSNYLLPPGICYRKLDQKKRTSLELACRYKVGSHFRQQVNSPYHKIHLWEGFPERMLSQQTTKTTGFFFLYCSFFPLSLLFFYIIFSNTEMIMKMILKCVTKQDDAILSMCTHIHTTGSVPVICKQHIY